jgi:hypothetical protein
MRIQYRFVDERRPDKTDLGLFDYIGLKFSISIFLNFVKSKHFSLTAGILTEDLCVTFEESAIFDDTKFRRMALSSATVEAFVVRIPRPTVSRIEYLRRQSYDIASNANIRTLLSRIAIHMYNVWDINLGSDKYPTIGSVFAAKQTEGFVRGKDKIFTEAQWQRLRELNQMVNKRLHDPEFPIDPDGLEIVTLSFDSIPYEVHDIQSLAQAIDRRIAIERID